MKCFPMKRPARGFAPDLWENIPRETFQKKKILERARIHAEVLKPYNLAFRTLGAQNLAVALTRARFHELSVQKVLFL